jgi:hypothetical protein
MGIAQKDRGGCRGAQKSKRVAAHCQNRRNWGGSGRHSLEQTNLQERGGPGLLTVGAGFGQA